MAMTSMEAEKIVSETVGWFRARVAQHYVTLDDVDNTQLYEELKLILSSYVVDDAIQNTQYNPKTDKVEEI